MEKLCYVAQSYHGEVDRSQQEPGQVEAEVQVEGGERGALGGGGVGGIGGEPCSSVITKANFNSELCAAGGGLAKISLGVERFETAEGIFKPEVWGLDQAGVHVLVKKAVTECSLDVRREVSQSIFLSGGLTMLPGFKQRLEAELEKILPVRPRVHASPYR